MVLRMRIWGQGQDSCVQGVAHRQDGGEGKSGLPPPGLGPEGKEAATSILETQRRELFLSGWELTGGERRDFLRWVIKK